MNLRFISTISSTRRCSVYGHSSSCKRIWPKTSTISIVFSIKIKTSMWDISLTTNGSKVGKLIYTRNTVFKSMVFQTILPTIAQ